MHVTCSSEGVERNLLIHVWRGEKRAYYGVERKEIFVHPEIYYQEEGEKGKSLY